MRELAQRENDGITVTLNWEPETDLVMLSVEDSKFCSESFSVPVPAEYAMDAFDHPFTFGPATGSLLAA